MPTERPRPPHISVGSSVGPFIETLRSIAAKPEISKDIISKTALAAADAIEQAMVTLQSVENILRSLSEPIVGYDAMRRVPQRVPQRVHVTRIIGRDDPASEVGASLETPLGIGNDGTPPPYVDAGVGHVIVGSTVAIEYGAVTVCSNFPTGGSGTSTVGTVNFANYALTATDKRLGSIVVGAYGAQDMGAMHFMTMNAGGIGVRMTILPDGKVGINNMGPNSQLAVSGLPTSTAGLASGDIWYDTAAGNVLKIVP